MNMQFDPHFQSFSTYLENAINQPSHFESLEALMADLMQKEITHGDILEEGISSPLAALAHVVNNPHLLSTSLSGADDDSRTDTKPGVSVSLDMLVRGANSAVHMAPIQAVPVAAITILGKSLSNGEIAPSQKNIGSVLVGILDRSQHMEPVQQKALQEATVKAFGNYRRAYPLDADAERGLSRNLHGDTATKLVTMLGFNPENVRSLSHSLRRSLMAKSEPALG